MERYLEALTRRWTAWLPTSSPNLTPLWRNARGSRLLLARPVAGFTGSWC
jgi:hypothetical protein